MILGKRDWLKVRMSMLWPWYFWMMRWVSSSVLNEFMRTNGTLQPYVRLRNLQESASLRAIVKEGGMCVLQFDEQSSREKCFLL
jgi:hypothetical protein